MLPGKVISLPPDAITRDKQPARSNERIAGPASHNKTQGQQLEYTARISPDRTDIQVDEKRVKLSPAWP
jgi:hemolysin D